MLNINRVTLTGNVTTKPDLRQTPAGTPVLTLRVAVNARRKNQAGEYVDKPNYFDVTTFGQTAESCAQYVGKGRPVAIDGRLDWSEWTTETGDKRQRVQVIADQVQFLWPRPTDKPEPAGDQPSAWIRTGTTNPEFTGQAADSEIPF